MAFDLNKGGEEKKKFDLSKTEDLGSSNNSGGSSKSGKSTRKKSTLVLLVIAVAIIGSGIWFISSKKDSNLVPEKTTTVAVSADSTESPVSTSNETTSANVDNSQVPEEPVDTENVVESSQMTEKPIVSSNTQSPSILQGTLEEKAKQVIRGDFGNGIERKNALGSEYKEIQKKVNEIIRKSSI